MDKMELYHFGIKGMKWGVRRAKNKAARDAHKLSKYKVKEIKKAEKKHGRMIDAWDKQIAQREKKLAKLQTGHNSYKIKEAKAKLKVSREKLQNQINLGKKEVDAIKKMKVSDMKAEKRAVGKAYVGVVAGGLLLGGAIVGGVAGGAGLTPDSIKSKRRTGKNYY
jgi:seryl-tRNA(Sec) selenium transferase